MTKGVRKEVNPGAKLQSLINHFEKTMKLILNEAGKPEFTASIAQLKGKREAAAAKKNKLNKDAQEVSRHLQKYPGLSRQVLTALRSKIAEYKELGVIEKYMTGLAK